MNKSAIGIVVGTIIVLGIGFVAGRMTMNPLFNSFDLGNKLPIECPKGVKC